MDEHSPVVVYVDQTGRERRLVLRLDHTTSVPRYEQLRGQLSVTVAVGRIDAGDRLPTVRNLADQLGLAVGTVARTYRELEHDGVVETRGRGGTYVVAEPPHSEPLRERRERLAAAAQRYVFEANQLGADADTAIAAIRNALAKTK